MKYKMAYMLAALLLTQLPAHTYAADGLGRLFTSNQDRARLDLIREQEIVVEEETEQPIEVDEFLEPELEVQEEVIKDTVTIKGLVQRSDGKNSAWINDSNTFEGDLETLYIEVKQEAIDNDKVKVTMPDKATEIDLKVGQGYDPNNGTVLDIQ